MTESGVNNSAGTSDKHVDASEKSKPPPKTPAERQRTYRLKKKLMSGSQNPSKSVVPVITAQLASSSLDMGPTHGIGTRRNYDNTCILYNYLTEGTRQYIIGGESTSEIHEQCSTPISVPPQDIHTVQMPQVFSSGSPRKVKIKKTIKQLRHQNALLQKKKEQLENQRKNLLLVLKLSPLQNLK